MAEKRSLNILIIDDSASDAGLLVRRVEQSGYDVHWERVDCAVDLRRALERETWNVILCDHAMPGFDGIEALAQARAGGMDLPFIFVSGTIGEDLAVEAMKAGAHDYVMKDNLKRLVPAIERELREAEGRRRQRAAEQLLADEAARRRILVEQSSDGIVVIDELGAVCEANRRYAEMLGYSPDEILQLHVWDWDAQWDHAHLLQMIRKVDETGSRFETRHRRKDGSVYDVEICNSGTTIGGRKLVFCVCRDISQRKRAEQQLRKLSLAVEQSPASIVITDPQGCIEYVNPKFVDVTGYSFEEVRGKNPSILKSGEVSQEVYADLWRSITAGGEWRGEFHNRRKDGSLFWEHAVISGIKSDTGQITHFLAVKEDITERKRAEEAQRQSEAEFRAMFEVASIGMAQANVRTGQWIRVNRRMCEITGYSQAEMLQLRVPEVTHPEDREMDWALFQRVVRGDAPDYRMEKRYVRKDGQVAWVNVNMSVVRGTAGQALHMMATIEDITERKRMEAQQHAVEAHLRQQQRLESIGTLAGGVAHEINNPINGIMNYAQLIQDRVPQESPLAEFAGEIVRETQRVAGIVRNLLLFSRIEMQSHSPARVIDIIEGTLSLIRTIIRHDQIALTVNVPDDLPVIQCRSQQIQQVLMNLMTNARDALNERYPGADSNKLLKLDAQRVEMEGRLWIRLKVEDHGTGILPEVRERMFDPFFTTKPRDKGTGLGLSISHGITKEHGGKLIVESEPGQFTRFFLELPVDNE